MMRELSLFTGAGGGVLATKHLLNWKTIGYVEKDEYCQAIIWARIADGLFDESPIFGSIEAFISDGFAEAYSGMVDVVSGGFPCQDISVANPKGEGIDGERSGLWREMSEVIRIIRPEFAFVENSPALAFRGLGRVLGDLASLGYDARWGVFSACSVGAPHMRARLFILAHAYGFGRELLAKESKNKPKMLRGKIPEETYLPVRPHIWDNAKLSTLGVVNGLSTNLDGIRAAGNAQVPVVAATAWKILSEDFDFQKVK